ncbi:alpha-L-rhamnosidase [Tichowtungia aerotolerans]|uniref:alpha-L-rhamnosidase n=1 Tax=Tichowtungia aerotolerans TaxID=2697043 RepID=A0A6P1MC35_9BACT|nr:alpha-L-rhamnosidase [Tichowtungia aerotolerans]QHI69146.1 family 78 glycoside hydrolase catalytic domain [Tichowtungia aerotolerans]
MESDEKNIAGLSHCDWPAKWIGHEWGQPCALLRQSVLVNKPVRTARIHATALGLFELRLNGKKVGNSELLPGWTDYRKRVYSHSFDITDRIVSGENVIGGMVAPGWFAGHIGCFGDKGFYGRDPWFSAVLKLDYEDGTSGELVTDPAWKASAGAVVGADLLMGEEYDARKEIAGWDMPGFDDTEWKNAVLFRPEEEVLPERIEPYPGVPVQTIAELPAQSITEPKPGVFVFDLGQNMVGVVRLKLSGVPRGTEIILKHGEMIEPEGTVYTANLRSARAVDRYFAKGDDEEIWQPRFTFHGFRYVQLEGLPAGIIPQLGTVTGVVWMSGLNETASFECSNEKVNRLFENIRWGFRGNYLEVPTDCPQRDERLGWTGDVQIFIPSAAYLADIRPFYEKWLVDLHDAQCPNGGYPDAAPFLGRMHYASAGWGDAGIICPYTLWQMYGDLEFIRPWWNSMKKYMELICTDDNRHNGPAAQSYGDWLHFGEETPQRLIGLAYRAYDARLMSEMAEALEKSDDAVYFKSEADKGRLLFRNEFFRGSKIAVETQTACALAIHMELLSGDDLKAAEECLFQCLENSNGYLTTGFIGTAYLSLALSKAGRPDLAVQLLLNEDHPSWLYEVNNGATTIWERWNSWTKENGFGDPAMNSYNHYAFGAVCQWMFESLVGIRPASPGFQTLEIKPCLTDRFDFVKGSYDSVQGRISSHWKKTSAGWIVEVETPVPAEVVLPTGTYRIEKGIYTFEVNA